MVLGEEVRVASRLKITKIEKRKRGQLTVLRVSFAHH